MDRNADAVVGAMDGARRWGPRGKSVKGRLAASLGLIRWKFGEQGGVLGFGSKIKACGFFQKGADLDRMALLRKVL